MERVVDAGGWGDCGFLSIIASLINQAAPPALWEDEVRAMRELLGAFWDLKDPPALDPLLEGESLLLASLQPDPSFPREDIRGRGVFMQDRDILLLVYLLDLEWVRVGDQIFTQQVPGWGLQVRERLKGPLGEFWETCWALKGKRRAHLYHKDLHFKAVLVGSPKKEILSPRPPPLQRQQGSYYY